VQGRERAELASGTWSAGRHQVFWDGGERPSAFSTGVYFMRLEAMGRTLMKRFVVAR